MGKRILSQRLGRSPIYRASTHKSVAPSHIPSFDEATTATVIDLLHNPGRGAPLAKLKTPDNKEFYVNAVEGMYVGQEISIYNTKELKPGDILKLKDIPPGTLVSSVERVPGDGGKLGRSSGSYVQVLGKSGDGIEVLLPSGKSIVLNPECRAVIGVVAGGGRTEKPFLKAGAKHKWLKAKGGKRWPRVRGVAMNPVDHPFGGGAHQHVGKPKTVARNAPPGKKVGSFGARRTGRRKR
ncbi:TPA: 50S ribosomal protein L2 [Candidatus Geothermarchaeota archaeon]|nr:50S ribosomal protein L2 [Candidatus Geothermarchaeota archaeon]HIQ13393.1 50S ribosomal protein L2 [Thermoprotei archaeon]